jgi:hypothetical protein
MTITFWSNDPLILFNKEYIFEIMPKQGMSYEQKMNSITRLIIYLTFLGYIFTTSRKLIIVCLAILFVIFILYKVRQQQIINEGFHNINNTSNSYVHSSLPSSNKITNPQTLETFSKSEFKEGTKKNPFSNVLLTDIMDDPNRNAAPPAFNPEIDESITKNVKKSVQHMNPGIKNTDKQLFSDLTDNFYLDQSNRAFYSTANSRVSNDQGAFGNFLYGNMPSSKESNAGGAMQRVKDSYRYTLY